MPESPSKKKQLQVNTSSQIDAAISSKVIHTVAQMDNVDELCDSKKHVHRILVKELERYNNRSVQYKTSRDRIDEAKLQILACLGSLYIMDGPNWSTYEAELRGGFSDEESAYSYVSSYHKPAQDLIRACELPSLFLSNRIELLANLLYSFKGIQAPPLEEQRPLRKTGRSRDTASAQELLVSIAIFW